MSIVAHSHPFVVGVDTHARNHVYAILDAANGALLDTQSFPSTAAGINRAIKWVARRTNADADTLWVIEGAASYGAVLAGTVAAHGFAVAEAPRMDAKSRRGVGEDARDAFIIANAARTLPQTLRSVQVADEQVAELSMLCGFDDDLAKQATATSNRIRGLHLRSTRPWNGSSARTWTTRPCPSCWPNTRPRPRCGRPGRPGWKRSCASTHPGWGNAGPRRSSRPRMSKPWWSPGPRRPGSCCRNWHSPWPRRGPPAPRCWRRSKNSWRPTLFTSS